MFVLLSCLSYLNKKSHLLALETRRSFRLHRHLPPNDDQLSFVDVPCRLADENVRCIISLAPPAPEPNF